MTQKNLPTIPLSDDLVDRIATEIAADVCHHIERMYPAAAKAVAWNSTKRSLQGVVRNRIAAAGKATEEGRADEWIAAGKHHRREINRLWKIGEEAERRRKGDAS